MHRCTLNATTEKLDAVHAGEAPLSIPALTVLFHPEVERVGETARLVPLLEGGVSAVSRLEPLFVAAGSLRGRPLADPYLSRSPLRFEPRGRGVRIVSPNTAPVAVGGEPLTAPLDVSAEELGRGLVIELSRRVVLLFHQVGEPQAARPELGMIGHSAALDQVRDEIMNVAGLDIPVLIEGESGSGKELVARALHESSRRRTGAFVAVNMASLDPSTAASALFGHVAGAFTGAIRDHLGLFAQADGGTLFLDEIGEAPVDVQPMLLRAIETGEFRPVGASRPHFADVRLLTATDASLEAAIEAGAFREPLYHRLASFRIGVPPLRDRRDDFGLLLVHFLREELRAVGEPHRLEPAALPWLTAELVARLAQHRWPGNIRQLRNIVRQLVVSSRGSDRVHIPPPVLAALEQPRVRDDVTPPPRAEVTEELLLAALRDNRWRPSAAAHQLGVARSTVYALIERSSSLRKARDITSDELRRAIDAHDGDLEAAAAELRVSKRGLQLRMRGHGFS